MDYEFRNDLKCIREILGITQSQLASQIGVQQATISRNEMAVTGFSPELLKKVYNYAFQSGVRLGRVKEMLYKEELSEGAVLLCHGSKDVIKGDININVSRRNNDFGQGFYAGETYMQSVLFVSGFENSNLYFLEFKPDGLTSKEYSVDLEWMMTIAYFRGNLTDYEEHPYVRYLAEECLSKDYIIAPIADNRMFSIINSFVNGDITDEQASHCLAATNLGKQYVFKSERALSHLKILEKTYISEKEKEYYTKERIKENSLGENKVKMARIKYRGRGKYIDELLDRTE